MFKPMQNTPSTVNSQKNLLHEETFPHGKKISIDHKESLHIAQSHS